MFNGGEADRICTPIGTSGKFDIIDIQMQDLDGQTCNFIRLCINLKYVNSACLPLNFQHFQTLNQKLGKFINVVLTH